MKKFMPELYRAQPGHPYNSRFNDRFGVFFVEFRSAVLKVIISAGDIDPEFPWDHVSVSLPNRCPNWPEMCFIKDLFFDDDEAVVQYHPPKSEYVNCHPYCLHMWKPLNEKLPLPPRIMVGTDEYLKGKENGK